MTGSTLAFDRAVVDDVAAYSEMIAGLDMDRWATGEHMGVTSVAALTTDDFTFSAGSLGFPMAARTTVPDDRIVVAHIARAPAGSRWSDFDLEPGWVLAYGPGALHTATSPAGFAFEYATASIDSLRAAASDLGVALEPVDPGAVVRLAPSTACDRVAGTLEELRASADGGTEVPSSLVQSIVGDMAGVLAASGAGLRLPTPKRGSSRAVVHRCIDYAESIQRIPSLQELCLVARVSERRLRSAFTDEFDQPPSLFFRRWALSVARQRLVDEGGRVGVTVIATDLGFGHLGRFAGEYRRLFGETPSATARTRRA